MENIEYKLYQGALLHDIGKLPQRSGEVKREKHQLLSTKFIAEWLEDDIVAHIVANHHKSDWRNVEEDSLRHKLALIVCEADSLASTEREKSDQPYIRPLDSIFNLINIQDKGRPDSPFIQPKASLSTELNKYVFPETYNKNDAWDKIASRVDRIDAWKAFERELSELGSQFKHLDADTLLYLFKKHLWCVPSAYYRSLADISLYDHSRMTAAISLCLYRSFKKEYGDMGNVPYKVIEDRTLQRYLLVGGGFSGVQKYLYGIAHKGALKGLKGRSFWLNQAIDTIAREILDKSGLPEANLIYANGGRFYLLLPEYLLETVLDLKTDIEQRIKRQDEKNLGLEFGYLLLNGTELGTPLIAEKWDELNKNIAKSKLQQFQSQWNQEFFRPFGPGGRVVQCQFTKKDLCTVEEFAAAKEVGSVKVNMEYEKYDLGNQSIFVSEGEGQPESERGISEEQYLGQIIGSRIRDEKKVMGFTKNSATSKNGDNFSVLDLEQLSFYKIEEQPDMPLTRIAWLNDDEAVDCLPEHSMKRVWKFYGGDWVLKKDKRLKEFEELASECVGIKRLAVLRMDVDNLGLVFKEGFGEKASFSRIAQLSTMLDFFFCGYLNQLKDLYWKAGKGVLEPKALSEREQLAANNGGTQKIKKLESVLQIVYAGGDDIFIIGVWNVIPDVALWIHEKFQKFTASSPSFTLSAGVSLFRAKYPMYKAARYAGDAERAAKNYERDENGRIVRKDAISLFGDVASWKEMEGIVKWVRKLYTWLEDKDSLDKSLINKLGNFYADYSSYIKKRVEEAEEEDKAETEKEAVEEALWSRARWQAAYTLQRFAQQNETYKQGIEELKIALFCNEKLIKKLGILTQWVDLLTRELTEDEN